MNFCFIVLFVTLVNSEPCLDSLDAQITSCSKCLWRSGKKLKFRSKEMLEVFSPKSHMILIEIKKEARYLKKNNQTNCENSNRSNTYIILCQ